MPRKPVQTGIFLGRGLPKNAPASFMDWGFVTLDPDGNLIDVESLAPDADMGGFKMGGIALLVGQQNIMPNWDGVEEKLRAAIDSENFAHPRMQDQINQWLEQDTQGEELHDAVKEAKGLLTLEDFGLAPVIETPVEEIKGG